MTIPSCSDAKPGLATALHRYAAGGISSEYERQRNHAILTTLSRASYGRAFQPGCSRGELTAQLARRCVQVVATDFLPRCVASTQQRCAKFINVEVHLAAHSLLPRAAGLLYGDAVHYLLGARLPLECLYGERYDDFRIDVWRRARQPRGQRL